MFYDQQPLEQQINYKKMLTVIGNLTALFSESECPYLPYRAHENIFCKYFEAENLARADCSADAKKGNVGVGLKTWMGNDDQKVAEFDKLRDTFNNLSGIELVTKIAEYRNERIRITMNIYGIKEMLYHVIKRVPGSMQVLECTFDYIDIPNIKLLNNKRSANNTYFTDGKHVYHFSSSKNTLYMIFSDMNLIDSFEVEIMPDPYSFLMELVNNQNINISNVSVSENKENKICLRLYSKNKDGKYVHLKSGLNQWNAGGRKRKPNEIYIPYPAKDRKRNEQFFPDKDVPFKLNLPDGTIISAKVCQQDNKAIMSNPNEALGKWLLRDVFELPEGTIVTYEMLEKFGIDSVIFTKLKDLEYSIDFSEIGTYEEFYN